MRVVEDTQPEWEVMQEVAHREPAGLWIYSTLVDWVRCQPLCKLFGLFLDCYLITRWFKSLQPVAIRCRVWARVHLVERALAVQDSVEGEIARDPRCFVGWHNSAQAPYQGIWIASFPCNTCGIPTGNYCDRCEFLDRPGVEGNQLCNTCEEAEHDCRLCHLGRRGSRSGF